MIRETLIPRSCRCVKIKRENIYLYIIFTFCLDVRLQESWNQINKFKLLKQIFSVKIFTKSVFLFFCKKVQKRLEMRIVFFYIIILVF